MIFRYSSRLKKLDEAFLNQKLQNAVSYDRIAGYFSSSVLEIAGEAIDNVRVRMICNSDLQREDILTATAAKNGLWRSWWRNRPEVLQKERLKKLYGLISAGMLDIRVLPDDIFGLIHGKAGVITYRDGSKTCFIGSINETYSGWRLNYEMLWEDISDEGIKWVQDEFDYFWDHVNAVPLTEALIREIYRSSERVLIGIEEWRKEAQAGPVAVESSVYTREVGLWEHQKYFVNLAFSNHQRPHGARFVLADMVGLGKTIQLALSAKLMALWGGRPILIIVPKTLVWQWQNEMKDLLDMPSAVWEKNVWIDENNVKYPYDITKCPRRVGIISQGMIINGREEFIEKLLRMEYECIIVDEAHKARRANLGDYTKPKPKRLMEFLLNISPKTKSMLLATATPVQIDPIECWDLLYILSQRDPSVLGSRLSRWIVNPKRAIELIMGKDKDNDMEEWLRDPFPPSSEDEVTFGSVRKMLKAGDEFSIRAEIFYRDDPPLRRKIKRIIDHGFILNNNPFIRHIVRRTREFLENNIDPETSEPYLKKVEVVLMGEDNAINLPSYLAQAYSLAEEFCRLLSKRMKNAGFLKVLVLKRMGSTIIAGRKTAERLLLWKDMDDWKDEEDEDIEPVEDIKYLEKGERDLLKSLIATLDANKDRDPKYELTVDLLKKDFLKRGCIIFSQYFDSISWIAENLSFEFKDLEIGLYAGGDKSGIYQSGIFTPASKEEIKKYVFQRRIRILAGTDAASEGLNLQTLGSLINLDLPWNPTRLEQRKGRIQRIGQEADRVYIYNMRYRGSVEDRVHSLLSERLQNISGIFGQLPDVLEDVWVKVALDEKLEAEKIIDNIPKKHPFELKYEKQAIGHVDWEKCTRVLNHIEKRRILLQGW